MEESKVFQILEEINLESDLNETNVIKKINDRLCLEPGYSIIPEPYDVDVNRRYYIQTNVLDDYQTLLLTSCKAGTLNVVKYLLENGADVNLENKYGSTPLYWAASRSNVEIVDILLANGADVNKANVYTLANLPTSPRTPIMKSTNLDIVKKLLEHNAKISNLSEMRFAIRSGATDVIKFLIEDSRIEYKDESAKYSIFDAASSGSIELLNYLCKKCEIDINTTNKFGRTVLHNACASDNLELVKHLVEDKRFDILAKTKDGETPFCFAARSNNLDIFKYMYKRINCEHDLIEDDRILEKACGAQLGTVKYLVEDLGIPITDKLLTLSLLCNNPDIFEYLLAQMSPICKETRRAIEKESLDIVVQVKNYKLLRYLIEQQHFSIKKPIGLLETAIENNSLNILKYLLEKFNISDHLHKLTHLAAEFGRIHIVKFFIEEKNVSVHDTDELGNTVLHRAARSGNVELNKYLVEEKEADIHKATKDNWIPLYYAAAHGYLDLVRYYIEDLGMNFLVPDSCGWTPLYLATTNACHFDVIKYLVGKGSDVNVRTNKGRVPIQGAVFTGHLEAVKYLLEHGATLENFDQNNHSPLFPAIEKGHLGLTKFLIEDQHLDYLAKDIGDRTVLHLAVHSGNLELVKYIYELEGVSKFLNARRLDNRWTPIHEATHKLYFDISVYLISKGARVNTADKFGNFPIHFAAKKGDEFTVGMLILKGSNINPKNITGSTPLHIASRHGHVQVVKRLIECGANIDVLDKNGNTSLDIARKKSFPEIIELLRSCKLDQK